MAEIDYEKQFNYLIGNTGKEQLYHGYQLWYKVRKDYWRCANPGCNSFLSTNGDSLKYPNKPLPAHQHESICPDDFKIRKHFNEVIKERVRKEIHIWPSYIFDEEVKKMQLEQKIPTASIAEYLKPYSHYKSGFDAMRATNKPKMPKEFDDFDFDKEEYIKFARTINKAEFLQYDNKNKHGNRIQIYASQVGIQLLSESKRWQSDGSFFCAPKPFKQVRQNAKSSIR